MELDRVREVASGRAVVREDVADPGVHHAVASS